MSEELSAPGTGHTSALDCADTLRRLFSAWSGSAGILAAVSGGPDSMALLHMLARWAERPGSPPIAAASVDHDLRPQAKDEAAAVHAYAATLGIAHATLLWRHDDPSSRLQERARNARYELLVAHAAHIGADVLMTAHHADDQAETVLFRLIRGSGLRGLAGMAAERQAGEIRIARPLLELRKRDLVAYCKNHGLAYCEDSSNHDPRFARVRMRNLLPELEKEGFGPREWGRFACRVQRADAALALAAEQTSARLVSGFVISGLVIDFKQLQREPEEIVLRVLLAAISRFDPAGQIRLERAETLLARLLQASDSDKNIVATLGKAKIIMNSKGMLTLRRQAQRKRGQSRSR